ncbi:MAG: transposase [Sulfuricaulis sp.]
MVLVARVSSPTSCGWLITATAYTLVQELRLAAPRTSLSRTQVNTLRERLIKLSAWIEVSARRILLHLPQS